MFFASHREMITSAAALCLRVGAGWPTLPCQVSGSTDCSTTTSVLPRLARGHSDRCTLPIGPSHTRTAAASCHSLQFDDQAEPLRFLPQVSKLPKELSSARHLCFSSDSSKLFASSNHSSVVVASLSKLECKYVHTLKPKSG